ncbi:MAG: N-acetylmuramoyl-L-alanine amidase [Burkholderiales bacterium]|nr:N-acetylmuramoyl-L-alanine amidase [Burkholderiales bacterium]
MTIAGAARVAAALCVLLLASGCATVTTPATPPAPAVPWVTTEHWGGERVGPDTAPALRHHITHITLHHGGVDFPRSRDAKEYLRSLQRWSRGTRGWIDLPYHVLIDLDGVAYEGRDLRLAGDTNTEYDPTGHALVVLLGNYDEIEPSAAQIDAVVRVVTDLARRYGVPVERIASHRDYAQTTCPGRYLYRVIENGSLRARVAAALPMGSQ